MYVHRVALTFLIFNKIIFRFNGFQPHHPLFISDYSYAHIQQLNVEDFVVEIHHGHFHSSLTGFFKIFGSNVVPDVYSWNFLKI